jgi:hypothetical protein
MNKSPLHTPIIAFIVMQIIWFLWYYVTLPGSLIPPNNPAIPKPSFRSALLKFITYQLPFYILILYFVFKGKQSLCDSVQHSVSLFTKICPPK